ncbi:hypothetical protein M3Y94_01037800 [Aphelenchoides besseyi]|nr:hypothetical protein M3Y94_01037800 [Aphelenchoides besseyi]KAI6223976.1 hypothetical protein M3Y95_00833800 [Aphelenchoides besseyi]
MDFLTFTPIATSDGDTRQPGPIKPKFFFTAEELQRSPSILNGLSVREEQQKLQLGCTMLRRMAERLNEVQKEVVKISQLCVSVSLIQLRRFFTIHSLKYFDAVDVGAAALFMTAKTEECPRRLETIVRAWYRIRYELDTGDYTKIVTITKTDCDKFSEYICWLENLILKSIGFNFSISVPHPIVLQLSQMHRQGDKKFHESVFWLTTDALHMTNWAVRYTPAQIGCAAFYMTALWKDPNYIFPAQINGKEWYNRMDSTITIDQLQEMTLEFLKVWKDFDKSAHLNMSLFDHKTRPEILDHGLPPANSSVVATPPSTQSQATSAVADSESSYADESPLGFLSLPPPPPPPSASAMTAPVSYINRPPPPRSNHQFAPSLMSINPMRINNQTSDAKRMRYSHPNASTVKAPYLNNR